MDQVEPMDIDNVGSDFDDKENSLLHSNVLPRTPCTEKGYEELDVSELNMKLRYSITPASSPMSKSFTANCKDNKTYSINEDSLNNTIVNNSTSLTRSLNATITKSDVSKSPKLPLQALPTDQYLDMNSTVRRSLDNDPRNITISINGNDIDENISLPSTSSSAVETPEATTPTKDIPKDGGSPIMRGLKTVLNMFRTSQSPIPPDDNLDIKEVTESHLKEGENKPEIVLASTPKACDKNKENSSKRNSPLKDSMSFKDDLERELQWKDDSTIIFKQEKIPIHKLFLQQSTSAAVEKVATNTNESEKFNSTVEYMDISYNDSVVVDKTMTDIDGKINSSNIEASGVESDGEFLDCETTYTKIDNIDSEQINTTIPVNTESKELLQEVSTDKNISLDESQAEIKNIANNTEAISKDVSSHGGNDQYEERKSLSGTVDNDKLENVINEIQELIQEENEETNGQIISSTDLSTIDGNVLFDEQKPLSSTLDNVKLDNTVNLVNDVHKVIPDEKEKDHIDQLIPSKDLSTIDGIIQIDEQKPLSNPLDNVKPENVVNEVIYIPTVIPDEKAENDGQLISSKELSTIDGDVQFNQQEPLSLKLDDVKSENVVNDMHEAIPNEKEEENNGQSILSKDFSITDANVKFDAQKPSNTLDNIKLDSVINNIHELIQDVKGEQNEIQFEELKTLSSTFSDVKPENKLNETYEQIPDVAIEECKKDSNSIDEIQVYKDVTSVLEVLTDKTESYNLEDQSNIIVSQKCENYGIQLDDIPQDSIELTFDVTKPLNVVTDDDNTLAKVHDKTDNFEITEQEKLEVIKLNSQPLNSGILQICESRTGDTVHDHADTLPDNQITKLECIKLEDNKIDNRLVDEKSEEKKNSSFVSKNELSNEVICHHTEEFQSKSDRVELTSLNNTIDSLDLNKQQDLEDKISCVNYVKNEVQSSSNDIIEKPIDNNGFGFNNSQPSDNTPQFSDTLQPIVPEVTELINNLPSDVPLPSDDDIEKDSLMDNFVIENKNEVEALSNVYRGSFSIKDQIMDSLEPMDVDIQDAITINSEHSNKIIEILPAANPEETPKNMDTHSNLPTSSDETINEATVLIEPATVNNPTFLDTSSELNKTKSLSLDKIASIESNEDRKHIDCEQIIEEIILAESAKIINKELKNDIMCEEGLNDHKLVEEEIVTSANSSPFVSVENLDLNEPKGDINLDEIESPFETKTKIAISPPISPKLNRKGYNINFDEIDDPFATKTNIRMSPPPESSPRTSSASINITQKKPDIQKRVQQQNRRKSQPERQKRDVTKKRFNNSYSSDLRDKNYKEQMNTTKTENDNKNIIHENYKSDVNSTITTLVGADQIIAESKDPIDNKCEVDNVSTSDNNLFDPNETVIIQDESKPHYTDLIQDNHMEQKSISDNISAARCHSKNVFNLPEIDDMNFNPFASKSIVRNSPSPSFEKETEVLEENNSSSDQITEITQKSVANATINIENQEDNIEPPDTISETFALKNIDNDGTLKEIATEDEDTVEGPFLEAEEFADVVKVSDFATEKDMMQFEDFHTAANPEVKDEDGELFIDAEAFEFLLNQNKSNVVADSGKESLFLKFDPLFAKRISSDGVLAALNRIQKRQSTPKKPPSNQNVVVTEERPSVSATNCNTLLEESNDENNVTITKPMMVVNPAINSLVSPRKSTTPPRINRRSLTFTSPAMAVIDRLLSLSGNSSTLDHDASPPRINRDYNDTDIALTQLRELLAEKEIHVHNLRSESKELKERLTVMESQVKTLEKESEERLKKVNDLNERLAEKTKINKSMAVVVEEYERTIASLIAEMDQEKRRNAEERARIISERDEQTAHLSSMEVSFSDLHSKYEKSKQIILSMKANEDTYKKSLKDFEENLLKMQNNYELLKQHATTKLNHANQELEKFNKAHESEVLKLNAMIKRKELHITSLEESLVQKTKANEELTAICDELINKVG